MPSSILIRSGIVLTMNDRFDTVDGDVSIVDGRIAAVAPNIAEKHDRLTLEYTLEVVSRPLLNLIECGVHRVESSTAANANSTIEAVSNLTMMSPACPKS